MQSQNIDQELICINCPRGCLLTAHSMADGTLAISGNYCARGPEYARQELTSPMRVLTALMRPLDSEKPVSVKTDRPVPRALLLDCASAIYHTHPVRPIRRGDILIRNLCGTGASVIATRDAY